MSFGNASFRLFPLPRLPVGLVLWTADDEFPARVSLLLDAACERQVPPDVVWAIAMLTLRMFADDDPTGCGPG